MVHYVIQELVDPAVPGLLANDLLAWVAEPRNGWVHLEDYTHTSPLAEQGEVVIAGAPEIGGHGHVTVVVFGAWKPARGYQVNGVMMPRIGSYPIAPVPQIPHRAALVAIEAGMRTIKGDAVGEWMVAGNGSAVLSGSSPIDFLTRAGTTGYAALARQVAIWARM